MDLGYLAPLAVAHAPAELAATGVAAAWLVGEALARRSTWRQGAPKRPSSAMDRGTYPIIAVGLVTGLIADLLGFLSGVGGFLPGYAVLPGIAIAALGLAIRGWALRTLGRFFTMPITIAEDHRIVRSGPYRWVRHPAYTGGFLTAVGLAVTLGSVTGVVVSLLACSVVYVYRIRIEEAALMGRFGEEYRRYAAETFRLMPPIY